MAWKGPEGLVDEVKTYIDANYVAKFAALNTEYGDATVLADLKRTYIGDPSTIQDFPALAIRVERLGSIRVHRDFIDGEATLNVMCFVLDTDEESLERRAYRVARGVVELLVAGMVSGDITWLHHNEGGLDVNYSPAVGDEGTFIKAALIQWTLKKREDI